MVPPPLWVIVLFWTVIGAIGILVVGWVAYLLTLLAAAAAFASGRAPQPGIPPAKKNKRRSEPVRFTILLPAHDEEMVLADTLASLQGQQYPAERYEVLVIADNCTDATAQIAREHACRVWERRNAIKRGKGYALAWAVNRLLGGGGDAGQILPDALVVIDADTQVEPGFLAAMEQRLMREFANGNTLCALQGRYGVLNVQDGWRAALMAGAFDLFNHIRPLGRERLGFSVGLKGNGMVFSRRLAETAPWSGRSITEDVDYGLDLLLQHGVRVAYVPEAIVRAQMPTTAKQAASQRERWENGRQEILRRRGPALFWNGIVRRDLRLFEAALDMTLPPFSELTIVTVLWGTLLVAGGVAGMVPMVTVPWLLLVGGAMIVGLGAYVLGGLRVAGAGREVYAALFRAPLFAVWKVALWAARPLRARAATGEWVRTQRHAPLQAAQGTEKQR